MDAPLGWMLPPKPAFMKFTTTPVIRAMTFTKQVFQDIVLPINKYVKINLHNIDLRLLLNPYREFMLKSSKNP